MGGKENEEGGGPNVPKELLILTHHRPPPGPAKAKGEPKESRGKKNLRTGVRVLTREKSMSQEGKVREK